VLNLIARRGVDPAVIKRSKEQFAVMDVDNSGGLEVADFPTSVCIQRSITVTGNAITAVAKSTLCIKKKLGVCLKKKQE
jgi:hypothetical protein